MGSRDDSAGSRHDSSAPDSKAFPPGMLPCSYWPQAKCTEEAKSYQSQAWRGPSRIGTWKTVIVGIGTEVERMRSGTTWPKSGSSAAHHLGSLGEQASLAWDDAALFLSHLAGVLSPLQSVPAGRRAQTSSAAQFRTCTHPTSTEGPRAIRQPLTVVDIATTTPARLTPPLSCFDSERCSRFPGL